MEWTHNPTWLTEAKDTFPLGTIKKYGELHLYVKVGGKKPWVYYATLGTDKANQAVSAGGVIVKDGKAVAPATDANVKAHGIDHPWAGQEIPDLIPGIKVGTGSSQAKASDGDPTNDVVVPVPALKTPELVQAVPSELTPGQKVAQEDPWESLTSSDKDFAEFIQDRAGVDLTGMPAKDISFFANEYESLKEQALAGGAGSVLQGVKAVLPELDDHKAQKIVDFVLVKAHEEHAEVIQQVAKLAPLKDKIKNYLGGKPADAGLYDKVNQIVPGGMSMLIALKIKKGNINAAIDYIANDKDLLMKMPSAFQALLGPLKNTIWPEGISPPAPEAFVPPPSAPSDDLISKAKASGIKNPTFIQTNAAAIKEKGLKKHIDPSLDKALDDAFGAPIGSMASVLNQEGWDANKAVAAVLKSKFFTNSIKGLHGTTWPAKLHALAELVNNKAPAVNPFVAAMGGPGSVKIGPSPEEAAAQGMAASKAKAKKDLGDAFFIAGINPELSEITLDILEPALINASKLAHWDQTALPRNLILAAMALQNGDQPEGYVNDLLNHSDLKSPKAKKLIELGTAIYGANLPSTEDEEGKAALKLAISLNKKLNISQATAIAMGVHFEPFSKFQGASEIGAGITNFNTGSPPETLTPGQKKYARKLSLVTLANAKKLVKSHYSGLPEEERDALAGVLAQVAWFNTDFLDHPTKTQEAVEALATGSGLATAAIPDAYFGLQSALTIIVDETPEGVHYQEVVKKKKKSASQEGSGAPLDFSNQEHVFTYISHSGDATKVSNWATLAGINLQGIKASKFVVDNLLKVLKDDSSKNLDTIKGDIDYIVGLQYSGAQGENIANALIGALPQVLPASKLETGNQEALDMAVAVQMDGMSNEDFLAVQAQYPSWEADIKANPYAKIEQLKKIQTALKDLVDTNPNIKIGGKLVTGNSISAALAIYKYISEKSKNTAASPKFEPWTADDLEGWGVPSAPEIVTFLNDLKIGHNPTEVALASKYHAWLDVLAGITKPVGMSVFGQIQQILKDSGLYDKDALVDATEEVFGYLEAKASAIVPVAHETPVEPPKKKKKVLNITPEQLKGFGPKLAGFVGGPISLDDAALIKDIAQGYPNKSVFGSGIPAHVETPLATALGMKDSFPGTYTYAQAVAKNPGLPLATLQMANILDDLKYLELKDEPEPSSGNFPSPPPDIYKKTYDKLINHFGYDAFAASQLAALGNAAGIDLSELSNTTAVFDKLHFVFFEKKGKVPALNDVANAIATNTNASPAVAQALAKFLVDTAEAKEAAKAAPAPSGPPKVVDFKVEKGDYNTLDTNLKESLYNHLKKVHGFTKMDTSLFIGSAPSFAAYIQAMDAGDTFKAEKIKAANKEFYTSYGSYNINLDKVYEKFDKLLELKKKKKKKGYGAGYTHIDSTAGAHLGSFMDIALDHAKATPGLVKAITDVDLAAASATPVTGVKTVGGFGTLPPAPPAWTPPSSFSTGPTAAPVKLPAYKSPTKGTKAAVKVAKPVDLFGNIVPGTDYKTSDLKTSSMSLKGGAGEKTVYEDPTGKKYVFKKAAMKGSGAAEPFRAYGQLAFSQIASQIKPEAPIITAVKMNGAPGAMYPFVDAADPVNLADYDPAKLTQAEAGDVASEHILDWMFSNHDTHGANLLRRKDGRIVGLDKEQAFKYFGNDELTTDYHPNAQHGENEPYYNKFWRAWSEGKVNFDPKSLGPTFDKINGVNQEAYRAALLGYAGSRWPDDHLKQHQFLTKAVARKNTSKRQFEKFITGLYKKKTKQDGNFTFDGGWSTSGFQAAGPTKKTVTQDAVTVLTEKNAKVSEYQDEKGNKDPSKKTVKIPKSESIETLTAMLDELGVPNSGTMTGGYYHMAFVDAAKLAAAKVTKEVTIPAPVTGQFAAPSAVPYLPDVKYYDEITHNSKELKTLKDKKFTKNGFRITLDGPQVEAQTSRVIKKIDSTGKEFYSMQFKFRPNAWNKLKKTMGTQSISDRLGDWDEAAGAFSEKGGTANHRDVLLTSVGKNQMIVDHNKAQYGFMGLTELRMYPEGNETLEDVASKLLDAAGGAGFAKTVLRDPTPEQVEIHKLSKLLWAADPQAADALPEEDKRTAADLKNKLAAAGVDEDTIASAKECESLPGYSSWVVPGRWRNLGSDATTGEPSVRYLRWSFASPEAAVEATTNTGCLSINERLKRSITFDGSSVGADVDSGCSDNITVRYETKSKDNRNPHSGYMGGSGYSLVIAPDVLDRLDIHAYQDDTFGACNPSNSSYKNRGTLDKEVAKQMSTPSDSAEMVIRKGIEPTKILRVVAKDNTYRNALLKTYKSKGISEVNGVPIEDYVVTASSVKEVYDKYVKPAGF